MEGGKMSRGFGEIGQLDIENYVLFNGNLRKDTGSWAKVNAPCQSTV